MGAEAWWSSGASGGGMWSCTHTRVHCTTCVNGTQHDPFSLPPPPSLQIAGHPSVAAHLNKLYGVLNGIDQVRWLAVGQLDSWPLAVGQYGVRRLPRLLT